MSEQPIFDSSSMISMIIETINSVNDPEIQSSMSDEDRAHVAEHIDALKETVSDMERRYPIASELETDDPETLMMVMGVLRHTSCIGDVIKKMSNAARRSSYKQSVRSIYRRRRCD